MNKREWNEGLNRIDPEIVEKYVEAKEKLSENKPTGRKWIRIFAIAACFAVVIGAFGAFSMLSSDIDGNESSYNSASDESEATRLPSVSIITSGSKLTGKQTLTLGDVDALSDGNASIISPGFYISTVVHARVSEVLPSRYYMPGYYEERYLVARLSVVEAIRGEGLPDELFLRFPYYSADIFNRYEEFIFSLEQVGVENFMMIDGDAREVVCFSHMFDVAEVNDLGYGSVIAFNGGRVDPSFYGSANHFNASGFIKNALNDPAAYSYPVGPEATLAEAKANIISLAGNTESSFVNENCDFVTADDVFVSEEGKQIRDYLSPSKTDVFKQELYIREDRVVAIYTRVINGFLTDEVITLNGYDGENGTVSRRGGIYTELDLCNIPSLGDAMENIDLSALKPPHTEPLDGLENKYTVANGVYRKVESRVYGIVRVMWYLYSEGDFNGYVRDDLYYLYDQSGNGVIVERDELKEMFGNDPIITRYEYNIHIGFAK